MLIVVETPLFQRQWPLYWTEDERGRFAEGTVVLLTIYAKSTTDNIAGPKLREIRRAIEE